jgi:TPR repeat protein
LLRAAALTGHPRAHELLGELYHVGKYVDLDLKMAATHYAEAIERGSITATHNLAWLLATMQDDDFADPRRAIELILPMVLYYGDWQHLDTGSTWTR